MATLKDKVSVSVLAAGSIGWTWYGLKKWSEEVVSYEWDTTKDKIKTIGKSVLAGIGYGSACTASAVLLVAAVQMWKDK